MKQIKKITILGATGSIGQSTVDIICNAPDKFDVHAVTANLNVKDLADIARKTNAAKAVIADEKSLPSLKTYLSDTDIECLAGQDEIEICAGEKVDIVMNSIVGFAGLKPLVNAIRNKNNVAIANKEPLVAAGSYIMELVKEHNVKILPVDSEHNAIYQVFENHNKDKIDKLILTASGGPFLDWKKEDIDCATPEQAIAHPNWDMGAKISVDSASMMNKALEIIEAAILFDMPADKIDVVIHRQSVIHSIVSYKDGSMLSQMGQSDMRTPIAYALSCPERLERGGNKLDIHQMSQLTFERPDTNKFPAITYAYKCLSLGQAACIAFNASNEVAVASFLNNEISFGDIMVCNIHAVDVLYPKHKETALKTIEDIEDLDHTIRHAIKEFIHSECSAPTTRKINA